MSVRDEEYPTEHPSDSQHGGCIYRHPAYGQVRISRPQGGHREMYASDLKHSSVVRIEITESSLDSHLGTNWYQTGKKLIAVELTESQWAAMVASAGMSPIPCTIRSKADTHSKPVPEILRQVNSKDKARREFKENLNQGIEGASALLEQIKDLVSKGKAGKADLLAVLGKAQKAYTGWPAYAEFMADSFEEEMEGVVGSAKIEVEAAIQTLVINTGIKALRAQGAHFGLEDNSNGTN